MCGNTLANENGKFLCTMTICRKEFDNQNLLIKHLRFHIRNLDEVTCPFQKWVNKYKTISALTSHLSKKHRNLNTFNTLFNRSENFEDFEK